MAIATNEGVRRTNADNADHVALGWILQFPVLGRRSVSPGFRQMFAVIGLLQSRTYRTINILYGNLRPRW